MTPQEQALAIAPPILEEAFGARFHERMPELSKEALEAVTERFRAMEEARHTKGTVTPEHTNAARQVVHNLRPKVETEAFRQRRKAAYLASGATETEFNAAWPTIRREYLARQADTKEQAQREHIERIKRASGM